MGENGLWSLGNQEKPHQETILRRFAWGSPPAATPVSVPGDMILHLNRKSESLGVVA